MARGSGEEDRSVLLRTQGLGLSRRARKVQTAWKNLRGQRTRQPALGVEPKLTYETRQWLEQVTTVGQEIADLAQTRTRGLRRDKTWQALREEIKTIDKDLTAMEQRIDRFRDRRLNHANALSFNEDKAWNNRLYDMQAEYADLRDKYDKKRAQSLRHEREAYIWALSHVRKMGTKKGLTYSFTNPTEAHQKMQSLLDTASAWYPEDWFTNEDVRLQTGDETSYSATPEPTLAMSVDTVTGINGPSSASQLLAKHLERSVPGLRDANWVFRAWQEEDVKKTLPYATGRVGDASEVLASAMKSFASANTHEWELWQKNKSWRNYTLGVLASL